MKARRLLVISDIDIPGMYHTGGVMRSTRSIVEYSKYFDIDLIIPRVLNTDIKSEEIARSFNIEEVLSFSVKGKILGLIHERYPALFYIGFPVFIHKWLVKSGSPTRPPDAIVILNEGLSHVIVGKRFKEKYGVHSMVLLQLPPFYHDKERRRHIRQALKSWYKELYGDSFLAEYSRRILRSIDLWLLDSKRVRSFYESHDLLVAVSRSIPLEMGEEWINKFHVLDPGVSLSDEDLILINEVKNSAKEKKDYIVFGGRPDPLKGFLEGLKVFKEISKKYTDLKLVVTGHLGHTLKPRIEKLIKRMSLDGKVILTGYIPRQERFKIVAEARLMLYPSHVDSYPYAVLESLYLGTPVIAYDIPALRFNYSNNPGVVLIKEGDMEALINGTINMLESRHIEIQPPKSRSWEDIMREELNLVGKLIEK
ncbi:MAG: glycosyltransferase family 4 protein [Desulfurococcaceae archaeon]